MMRMSALSEELIGLKKSYALLVITRHIESE